MGRDEEPRKSRWLRELDRYADWCAQNKPQVANAQVPVRTETVRRYFNKGRAKEARLKKGVAIVYRGMTLHCIGSQGWRNENQDSEVKP